MKKLTQLQKNINKIQKQLNKKNLDINNLTNEGKFKGKSIEQIAKSKKNTEYFLKVIKEQKTVKKTVSKISRKRKILEIFKDRAKKVKALGLGKYSNDIIGMDPFLTNVVLSSPSPEYARHRLLKESFESLKSTLFKESTEKGVNAGFLGGGLAKHISEKQKKEFLNEIMGTMERSNEFLLKTRKFYDLIGKKSEQLYKLLEWDRGYFTELKKRSEYEAQIILDELLIEFKQL
ncbi:MAG: hypothetical protein ACRCTZ_15050 [Sarcina sp.]